MQTQTDASVDQTPLQGDFTIELGGKNELSTLRFKGRAVADVPGQAVEAQFVLPDHSVLVMVSDNTPFREVLTLVLVGPDLVERDREPVGGAYPQGFLAYVERLGPDEIAFCWHDLDLVVTVRRYWSWFGFKRRWLKLRDTVPQRDPHARARAPKP